VADTAKLSDFIRREFLFDKEALLGPDDALFPEVIDSLGVMEVVDFIEADYGITLEEDELLVENFRTLRAIGELIDRKRG
jgi:acyl carrier protein